MAPQEDKTKQNIVGDNWADNLLVKDQDGKLGYLKPGKKAPASNPVAPVSPAPSMSTDADNAAPLDDSFAPVEALPGRADDKSELIFHPDDKQDIEKIASEQIKDDSKKYGVEKIADRLIEKHELKLDEENNKAFVDAVYNFFRNRKKAISTREFLADQIISGKGKLKPDTVDSILSVIKGLKKEIDEGGGLVVRMEELKTEGIPSKPSEEEKIPVFELEEGEEGKEPEEEIKEALAAMEPKVDGLAEEPESVKIEPKPAEPEPKAEEKKPEKEEKEEKEIEIDVKAEKPKEKQEEHPRPTTKPTEVKFELPDSAVKPVEEKKDEPKPAEPEPKAEEEKPEPEPALPTVSRPKQAPAVKKQVSDVVSANKPLTAKAPSLGDDVLTGPVKELQSMDLVNFRRLGDSATARIDKILEKINLLEQDSYTKKAQGVAGWRNSPVYKQYLELGAESMINGQEVAALIEKYKADGKESLELDEFSAISDLNKKLRF